MDAVFAQIKNEAKARGKEKGAKSAFEIISELKDFDRSKPIIISMKKPIHNDDWDIVDSKDVLVKSDFLADSWRGSYDLPAITYDELSDDPAENYLNITVQDAIDNLQKLNGTEVTGYKGGDFILDGNDYVFIANYGESNDQIAITEIIDEGDVVVAYTNYDMY